jgi:hypothetical protein
MIDIDDTVRETADHATAASSGAADAVAALMRADGPLSAAWGVRPAVVRQADLAGWMPSARELLETPLLRPPYLRAVAAGKAIPLKRYCRATAITLDDAVEHVVDPRLVQLELDAGSAVKFNRMEFWCAAIAAMAGEFGRIRGKQVKVWGFLSPRDVTAFPSHRDPAHVIAVQLEGTKQWRLDGPCPDDAWGSLAPVTAVSDPEFLSLEPGDVLYLPHGYAHSAASLSERSFHVSFALEGTTAGELRTAIVKGIYDHFDRDDGTELRQENAARLLSQVSAVLTQVADRLSSLAGTDPAQISTGDISAIFHNLHGAVACG